MRVIDVFRKANLIPLGPVRWGTEVSESNPGVYVVARVDGPRTDCRMCSLPLIEPVPADLIIDRAYEELRWFPSESVVYIGKTDRAIQDRLGEFYSHKVGAPSPHAGGQILKLLNCDLWVFWAPSNTPWDSEQSMISAFKQQAGGEPFGNSDRKITPRIRRACDSAEGRKSTTGTDDSQGKDDRPKRIRLPEQVAAIYRAVAELEALYQRKFTPDGHLVGSIGEVVAAEALGLTLYEMSHAGHDAYDANGDVQIKMTAGRSVAMYYECNRLVVLRVVSPEEAEIVYDGPGKPAWDAAGKMAKNGQRTISLTKLRKISAEI